MASSFDDLQLNPKLLQALRKKGFATPTPVQAACVPEALSGKDLVAQARTGTGKTLAYVLPALHRIVTGSNGSAGWQALILVPTRELCEQVKHFELRVACWTTTDCFDALDRGQWHASVVASLTTPRHIGTFSKRMFT